MATLVGPILALGTAQTLTSIALLVTIVRLTVLYLFTIRYPANLPRVREDEKAMRFSIKTRLAYYTDCKNLFKEAYEKVSPEMEEAACTQALIKTPSIPNMARHV